ncbi:MAG: formyltetrahydrofolate deformylase [Betaproteobacteria bacterium]|nr:formyltetrahydrofolate deformylase [Betaproteobacteria bacterium]
MSQMSASTRRYTLTLSCAGRLGIVAAISGLVARHQGWITEANHYVDPQSGRLFMRIEIVASSLSVDLPEFRSLMLPIADEYGMKWRVNDSAERKRVVILVSKQAHCLYDLLSRWQSKDLNIDIPCVISNHESYRDLVQWHGIPFHHVPVTPDNKAEAYGKVEQLYREAGGEVMVLARYMQILSPEMCERLSGQIINIHHSFLPSFIGGKPYHQAHERGVKLIGATCHYVTTDLDEGPIIEQDVIRIDHADAPEDLVQYGQDIEKTVLARGLRYHLEDRVFLNGRKTVVFR